MMHTYKTLLNDANLQPKFAYCMEIAELSFIPNIPSYDCGPRAADRPKTDPTP